MSKTSSADGTPRPYPALDLEWLGTSPRGESLDIETVLALDDLHPTGIQESDTCWRVFFATPDGRDAAVDLLGRLLAGRPVRVRPIDVPDENWAYRCQAQLPPAEVGRIVVAPPWSDTSRQGDRLVIRIEPSMGFGTGHHASTRLCLRALQQLPLEGLSVLDVGTGSGVLAIAAALMGASSVVALDDDADAIAAARDNCRLNGIGDRVALMTGDFRQQTAYRARVVVANLTGEMLTREMQTLAALVEPGGWLAVSGYTVEERDEVLHALEQNGLCTAEWEEAGWSAAMVRVATISPDKTSVTAADWIAALGLLPHPEGGYYAQTYRAPDRIGAAGLPDRYGGPRSASTAIYFLITSDQPSRLHRLRSDEVWHFYAGSPLTLHVIHPDGTLCRLHLGGRSAAPHDTQAIVPAGCWFGATVDEQDSYALVGCTVAPGFTAEDFELGHRAALAECFPQHRDLVERLTSLPQGAATG